MLWDVRHTGSAPRAPTESSWKHVVGDLHCTPMGEQMGSPPPIHMPILHVQDSASDWLHSTVQQCMQGGHPSTRCTGASVETSVLRHRVPMS